MIRIEDPNLKQFRSKDVVTVAWRGSSMVCFERVDLCSSLEVQGSGCNI